jgi:hypothetical protein
MQDKVLDIKSKVNYSQEDSNLCPSGTRPEHAALDHSAIRAEAPSPIQYRKLTVYIHTESKFHLSTAMSAASTAMIQVKRSAILQFCGCFGLLTAPVAILSESSFVEVAESICFKLIKIWLCFTGWNEADALTN